MLYKQMKGNIVDVRLKRLVRAASAGDMEATNCLVRHKWRAGLIPTFVFRKAQTIRTFDIFKSRHLRMIRHDLSYDLFTPLASSFPCKICEVENTLMYYWYSEATWLCQSCTWSHITLQEYDRR